MVQLNSYQSTIDESTARTKGVAEPTLPDSVGSYAFSLSGLFQILTGCCLFFALFRISPELALLTTLAVSPAIIRTTIAADLYRKKRLRFCWVFGLWTFLESFWLSVLTAAMFSAVCLFVAFGCGLIAMLLAAIAGASNSSLEVGFISVCCGIVWGFGAAVVVTIYCARFWKIKVK